MLIIVSIEITTKEKTQCLICEKLTGGSRSESKNEQPRMQIHVCVCTRARACARVCILCVFGERTYML
jgi:hypothetical protein